MIIPARLASGRPQTITFPKIANQKPGAKAIELRPTSSAGLPVDYYVVAGPAEVDVGFLRFTPIPLKSRYPVKVTVAAYQ
jgi:hypothetical protein